jgi:hypothetical protein
MGLELRRFEGLAGQRLRRRDAAWQGFEVVLDEIGDRQDGQPMQELAQPWDQSPNCSIF